MVDPDLEMVFPALRGQAYQITSPIDDSYNCIAFAAGDTRNWWWPDAGGEDYWPATVARQETLVAFQEIFATLGYLACDDEELESWSLVQILGLERMFLVAA